MTLNRQFTEFERACLNGDLEQVQSLLPENINYRIDYKISSGGQTPLILAILSKNTDAVRFLLEQGADPNLTSHVGPITFDMAHEGVHNEEPLYVAVWLSTIEIVELLIAYGADVNPTNNLLSVANHANKLDIIRLLLEKGANPNLYNRPYKNHLIPLFQTINKNQVELLRLFYQYGADINAKNSKGETALFIVTGDYNLPIVQELVHLGIDINHRRANGETALSIIKRRKCPNIIKYLEWQGAVE